jgi:multidrug efflux pump subunit AcrA (membrane-fusion protein)
MSEIRETSDTDVDTSEILMDLGPLLDNDTDTEDFGLSPMLPKMRPPRKRTIWLPLLIIGLVVILIGAGIFTYLSATRPPAVQYTQTAASIGNLAVTVSATGPVEPNAVYNLNFAAAGQIASIKVKVGQTVKNGQLLATLNSTSLQDAVNQAQTAVTSAQNAVGNAENSLGNSQSQGATSLNIASINEQNALNNCTNPTTTGSGGGTGAGAGGAKATPTPAPTPNPTTVANCEQLARDQFAQSSQQESSSITSASNQVSSSEQQLATAQANLQTAQDNLKEANLTAPHAGIIESVNGLVGETAGSGGGASSASGSSSSFIVLVDSSSLNVAAQVNEADIANISVNQSANFTVAAYPSQTFLASVSSIDTQGSTSSSVVTYLVNLAVNMPSVGANHVYPGMTATVNITTAERIGTLLVPSAALTFSTTAIQDGELTRAQITSLTGTGTATSTGTTGSRGLAIELENGKLVPVLVTTGLTNGTDTEILSGLQEGDQVVISQTGGKTTTGTATGAAGAAGFGGAGGAGGGFGGAGGAGGRGGRGAGGANGG